MTPWADVRETHTAALFFAGDRVLKVKKPVRLGFVDLSDRAARVAACHEELRLNRRLAPDVYVGIAEITLPDGAVEPAVVMRRLPGGRTLAARVAADDPRLEVEVDRLAATVAAFHRSCPVVGRDLPADAALPLPRLWHDNLSQVRRLESPFLPADEVDAVAWLAGRYASGRSALFAERLRDGFVRDGHGDLLADDVFLLDDGPRILDCLEFDPRLRIGDVLLDVAFLAMDLECLGRGDLAVRFLRAYAVASGEAHARTLEHYAVAHRALVRAKVAAIRAADGDAAAGAQARALLALARRHAEQAQVRVVVVGGLPGAGKTTLAAEVADRIGGLHLSSDRIRWELVPHGERYDATTTDLVYATLLDRAADAVARGQHVVLDATWSAPAYRAAARKLAATGHADLQEVVATVDDDTARARLRGRRTGHAGASEATPEVRARLAREFVEWPQALVLDTRGDVRRAAAAVIVR